MRSYLFRQNGLNLVNLVSQAAAKAQEVTAASSVGSTVAYGQLVLLLQYYDPSPAPQLPLYLLLPSSLHFQQLFRAKSM